MEKYNTSVKITYFNVDWLRIKSACMTTISKQAKQMPGKEWRRKLLICEHSPIRRSEISWKWDAIPYAISTHFARHHEGCEKFVHTQREDRRKLDVPRDELPQGSLNDMDMVANAQALINISRKRLCSCASPETRTAWKQVKEAIRQIDPVMADKMVPECVYRGFCPEWMKNCGYCNSEKYKKERETYLKVDYEA